MELQVKGLVDSKEKECLKINGIGGNNEMRSENEKEPSEGTTTDKIGMNDPAINHIDMEFKDSSNDVLNNIQEQNNELIKGECVEIKQELNQDEQDDYSKQDNQGAVEEEEPEEDEEEEVDDKDEEVDKMDNEKSNKDLDNQDGAQCDDKLSFLGRNRRVRQKNRYFLDFHCIDLTKGARSNRDDYDAFNTTTGTRSSNRRSTTDSNRANQDEPEVFESKYCRKCLSKTPHDFDGGCQACLYKKIVESSKRQKPSSQRSRSAKQNDIEPESTSSSAPLASTNKRKSNKQGGSKNKYFNQKYRNVAEVRNCTNNNVNNANTTTPSSSSPPSEPLPPSSQPTSVATTNSTITNTNANNIDSNGNNNNGKLPKLDSWTPDEVAEYIMSKGFAQEAELFKTQSVDGISLLLMQRTDFTYGLKIKLGPALKIYDQVCKLKKEYFKTVTISQQ